MLPNDFAKSCVLGCRRVHAVLHEGVVDESRIEFDNDLTFDELALNILGSLDPLGYTSERLRDCPHGARLPNGALHPKERTRPMGHCLLAVRVNLVKRSIETRSCAPLFAPPDLFHQALYLAVDEVECFNRAVVCPAGELLSLYFVKGLLGQSGIRDCRALDHGMR